MKESDPKATILETIATLESKMDFLLSTLTSKPDKSRYMTAQDIQKEIGIARGTVLNRSNLLPSDKNYIPSIRLGGRRKYFERKIIERLFNPGNSK